MSDVSDHYAVHKQEVADRKRLITRITRRDIVKEHTCSKSICLRHGYYPCEPACEVN